MLSLKDQVSRLPNNGILYMRLPVKRKGVKKDDATRNSMDDPAGMKRRFSRIHTHFPKTVNVDRIT
jgi:hypothetical protein